MSKTTIFFSFIILLNFFSLIIFEKHNSPNIINVIIKPGMNLEEISVELYSKKIIKSPNIFKIWIKLNFLEKKLKFGEFVFEKSNSINDVTKKLINGDVVFRKITIIEGSNKYELLKTLKEIDPKSSLEYDDISDLIIADTYSYQVTDSAERILNDIKKISYNFSKRIWSERTSTIPINNINEMFILASIVEKETSIKDEKPIISGVFYNRLNKNMRLQSDPTVVYAITEGKYRLKRSLTRKDLKFKSIHNTYVINGLPPTIIGFPGKDSLLSTIFPKKSDLLYFVAKNKGGEHYFSSNYKQHLKNIKASKDEKK
ncbi:MAG: hypothetical protein CMM98_03715 [Rickettsiales bacterium]|nr:hypothetical protein [Rickettsiales bacterium]